jgi:hypothetical protein
MADTSAKLTIRNRSDRTIDLVLEPWGEVYPVEAGQTRGVTRTGESSAELTIDVSPNEVKIWEEGAGQLSADA